jgi:hypothetical protein
VQSDQRREDSLPRSAGLGSRSKPAFWIYEMWIGERGFRGKKSYPLPVEIFFLRSGAPLRAT